MDYEGFRQMVLGAHLFKISSKELIDLNADRTGNKTGGNQSIIRFLATNYDEC